MIDTFVLGADVGGATTKIALACVGHGRPPLIWQARYPSRDYATLAGVVEAFLAQEEVRPHAARIASACLFQPTAL